MGRLRRQAINLATPRKVSAWRDAPGGSRYVQRRDTPDQIRAADTTAGQNVAHLLDSAH